ncbi:DNA glycosylase superfamily protein [Prunus dulcis]|uniref:DNA glycosylase superfamily protein n=1 Tax=Prunus dulcis TaxID=3755 RepID=A0A4Y1R0D6_PRUDU|nr:DNA glycosylase superfamily protein [Prunus dulcis]
MSQVDVQLLRPSVMDKQQPYWTWGDSADDSEELVDLLGDDAEQQTGTSASRFAKVVFLYHNKFRAFENRFSYHSKFRRASFTLYMSSIIMALSSILPFGAMSVHKNHFPVPL